MPYRPPIIENLRAEIRGEKPRPAKRNKSAAPDPQLARDLFTVYTGNRWMELGKREAPAKMLFGQFWYQHEICFLFASTNTGKSVLAVQIGNAIARGSNAGPFPCQTKPSRVLYADFELSNLQFHSRYIHNGKDYQFHDNFMRAQFNPGAENPDPDNIDNFQSDEFLLSALEYRVQQLNVSVLIIDNISCLGGGTGNAVGALRIMNRLNYLRNQYKLSILVLAHTPKRRHPTMPLSSSDLLGSKLLINFADSAFTIGISQTDNSLRYLKQIKQRNSEQVYGQDNVCLGRIKKWRSFLKFNFKGYASEASLLPGNNEALRKQQKAQISQLVAEGLTQREISKRLGISLGLVNKLGQM